MVRYVARDRIFFIIVVELVLKIPCHGIFGVNSQFLRFWDWLGMEHGDCPNKYSIREGVPG